MIIYATDENFEELTAEGVALVDFFGENCGPCKMLARVLEDLDDEMPFVSIIKVDVGTCPKTTERFGVQGVPDVHLMKNGKSVEHFLGPRDLMTLQQMISTILYE